MKISEDGKVQTLTSRMGTGGMNVPLLLKIRSGCEGGGKGPLIQEDKSATLSCNNDQTLFAPCSWDGGQVSPTLTKEKAADAGQRQLQLCPSSVRYLLQGQQCDEILQSAQRFL